MSTSGHLDATSTLLNLSITSRELLMSTSGRLEYKPIIGSKRDIIYSHIDIIRSPSSHLRSIKDSFKALFGILLYPPNYAAVIELGAVSVLFSLAMKDGRVGIVVAVIGFCEIHT